MLHRSDGEVQEVGDLAYTSALRGSGSFPNRSSGINTLSNRTEVVCDFPEP